MNEKTGLQLDKKDNTTQSWRLPTIIAVIIAIVGLAAYITQGSSIKPLTIFFATPTSTPIVTYTPVLPTVTITTPTEPPTVTHTATRSGPISYIIKEGDTLYYVADEYGVDIEALIAYNLAQDIDLTSFLQVNQEILIPPPDFKAPTLTPMPSGVSPGTIIDYTIRPGDILQLLAEEFNTTIDAIVEQNEELSENPNILTVGKKIRIPIDIFMLTPATPTRQPSATPTHKPSSTPTP